MKSLPLIVAMVVLASVSVSLRAADQRFTGSWTLKIPLATQHGHDDLCGGVELKLTQTGDQIRGTYHRATANCGRIDDGGAINGIALGDSSVLTITSARNGAIAIGLAKLRSDKLIWHLKDYVRLGEPDGDDLIVSSAVLERGASP